MPNCQVYRRWMSLKLDGMLDQDQERALQAHLPRLALWRGWNAAWQQRELPNGELLWGLLRWPWGRLAWLH